MKESEVVTLEGPDAFLDAFCMQYNTSIVDIDRKLAALHDDNPNKAELMRYRHLIASANSHGDLKLLNAWLHSLMIGLKAATHTIPLALVGERHKANQKKKAQMTRSRIKFDGEEFSIKTIIDILAARTDELGDHLQTSDLWPELFSALDDRGMNPIEIDGSVTYEKDDEGNRDSIKKTSFGVMVSRARKTKR